MVRSIFRPFSKLHTLHPFCYTRNTTTFCSSFLAENSGVSENKTDYTGFLPSYRRVPTKNHAFPQLGTTLLLYNGLVCRLSSYIRVAIHYPACRLRWAKQICSPARTAFGSIATSRRTDENPTKASYYTKPIL